MIFGVTGDVLSNKSFQVTQGRTLFLFGTDQEDVFLWDDPEVSVSFASA